MAAPHPFPTSICIVRLSALGDVVMVLPLIRAMQRQWPEAKITWVCGTSVYPVLKFLEGEGVEMVPIEKPKGLGDYLAFRRQMAGRTFDALLALQASWRANWLYPCIRAKRKIGYSRDRAKDLHGWFVEERVAPAEPHIVDGFFQFGDLLGLRRPAEPEWRLAVDSSLRARINPGLPARYMALNACSSKPERDWMPERYAAVIDAVKRIHGIDTVLVGGPADREKAMAAGIEARVSVSVRNLVGRTRLGEMFAVLEGCTWLLAPDTGAVHIANALGRPVCGLYAVAPSSRTGPYPNIEYCVDHFERALREFLHKDPSEAPWAQRVHDPRAMAGIEVAEVLEKIELVVSKGVS